MKCILSIDLNVEGYVAPLVGAWIEIDLCISDRNSMSVAPLVGAWIEIVLKHQRFNLDDVAPLVGAWIEITNPCSGKSSASSLPSWERGLK